MDMAVKMNDDLMTEITRLYKPLERMMGGQSVAGSGYYSGDASEDDSRCRCKSA